MPKASVCCGREEKRSGLVLERDHFWKISEEKKLGQARWEWRGSKNLM